MIEGMTQESTPSGWELFCPVCGQVFDSFDSYGDTRAMIRSHIKTEHPESSQGKHGL